MVIEHFRNGDAAPVYRRFMESGRTAPEGLAYISSWVNEDLSICYQVMETADRRLLEQWMSNWADLVEFEVHSIMTSQEAAQRVVPKVST
jgi:oligoribonuclease (3'-5' exoribonuclease)